MKNDLIEILNMLLGGVSWFMGYLILITKI